MASTAEIGVFGGSGFYEWLEDAEEVRVDTPYGAPSGALAIADVAGRRVAFMPRHGPRHEIPAPFVNYRANVWAMRQLVPNETRNGAMMIEVSGIQYRLLGWTTLLAGVR